MTLVRAPLACALDESHRGKVAVMGNFDGVHRGHQALIAEARTKALSLGRPLAAVTFEPHPRRVFNADAEPFILTPLPVKAQLLSDQGCETVFALPFNPDLFRQTPEQFVEGVLDGVLGLAGVVTGTDFKFGAGRTGSSETLAKIAESLGLHYHAIAPVGSAEEKYSSSQARDALRRGDLELARHVLGYDWFLEGTVSEGRRLARTIGFPTANIALGDVLRPRYGVYAVEGEVGGTRRAGIANIGVRPTIDGKEERLEVHLFDWEGDLYGKSLRCHFISFLRDERPMDGLDALKRQIALDCEEARRRLGA